MTLPFHGHPDWQVSTDTADRHDIIVAQNIGVGANVASAVIDMRPYQSFYFRASASVVPVPTGYGWTHVTLIWTDSLVAGTVINREDFAFFPFAPAAGVFPVPNDGLYVQGPISGPFVQLDIVNNGPDIINAGADFYGNTRALPHRTAREQLGAAGGGTATTDLKLVGVSAALGAGAVAQRILRMSPGPVSIRQVALTAGMLFQYYEPGGTEIHAAALAAGVEVNQEKHFGRRTVRAQITNTGAVAGTYGLTVVGEANQW